MPHIQKMETTIGRLLALRFGQNKRWGNKKARNVGQGWSIWQALIIIKPKYPGIESNIEMDPLTYQAYLSNFFLLGERIDVDYPGL